MFCLVGTAKYQGAAEVNTDAFAVKMYDWHQYCQRRDQDTGKHSAWVDGVKHKEGGTSGDTVYVKSGFRLGYSQGTSGQVRNSLVVAHFMSKHMLIHTYYMYVCCLL